MKVILMCVAVFAAVFVGGLWLTNGNSEPAVPAVGYIPGS